MRKGLLIVNADDWGMDAATTDAIAACFDHGRITSASAMVYMEDSDRAARLARERSLPVGLHLNLARPFTDAAAPAPVRERQRRLARYLGRARWRRWVPSPLLRAEVARCVEDQRERFAALYGAPPTHLDGEQHMHTWPTALAALPRGARIRPTFTFVARERPAWNRLARAGFNAALRRRFVTPRYFFSIRELHPALGGEALEERLDLAAGGAVEVMVHPGWEDERALLLADRWARLLEGRPLGSYADLRS